MSTAKPKVLILVSHYLPGFRAGGPIVSVSNLVAELSADFDFVIVTRDRDIHDQQPYPQYPSGRWHETPAGMVYYASQPEFRFDRLCRLISSTPHDILFLNSFFDTRLSVLPLLARRLGLIPRKKLLIAPRGEFAPSALKLKSWKKLPYLRTARAARLIDGAVWMASSSLEANQVRSVFGVEDLKIQIASDLPRHLPSVRSTFAQNSNIGEPLRVVFLSRISPMKNLDFALRVLAQTNINVVFDIFGPIEDAEYWSLCKKLIGAHGPCIKANYYGAIEPDKVFATLGRYDLFFLPTRGENFGHVIIEALLAGTPVLISDRTSWAAATDYSCTVIPLSAGEKAFANFIDRFQTLPPPARNQARDLARRYAESHLNRNSILEESRHALLSALAQS